jgi:uncharacterized membrane protein HdeD (DUF308 family)
MEAKGNRKTVLRVLGFILGLLLLGFAIFPIAMPTSTVVVFYLIGFVFLAYGITGKSSLKGWRQ